MAQPEAFSVWRASHDIHSRKAMINEAVQPAAGPPTADASMAARPKQQAQSYAPSGQKQGNTFGAPMSQMTPEEVERHKKSMDMILNEILPLRMSVRK